MRTFALDVEQASSLPEAVCQIGLAQRVDDTITDQTWNVNPGCAFDPLFSAVHGITPASVATAPPPGPVLEELRTIASGHILITPSDIQRKSIQAMLWDRRAAALNVTWVSLSDVASRVWPGLFDHPSIGLTQMTVLLGLPLPGLTAAGRARTMLQIAAHAQTVSGVPIFDWANDATRHPAESRLPAGWPQKRKRSAARKTTTLTKWPYGRITAQSIPQKNPPKGRKQL